MELPIVGRVRKHHAVEHATVAVLFERRGRQLPVVGHSDFSGFRLVGPFPAEEVEAAAGEALRRLVAGESRLALTPMCGTNIAATAVLAGGAAIVAAGQGARRNVSRGLTAALAASLIGPRAGLWLQRVATVDAAVDGLRIAGVSGRTAGGGRHHVRVRLARGATPAAP
jgi:hypothetical protein